MLIEWAMATFGVVIPGVGTLHAPYSAWGLAATLQKLSAYTNVYYAGAVLVAAAIVKRLK